MKARIITLAAMTVASATLGVCSTMTDATRGVDVPNRERIDEEIISTFIDYAKINSQSHYPAEGTNEFTMTPGQHAMALRLLDDAKKAADMSKVKGVKTELSPDNYVYVTIPASKGVNAPALGISCHLDVTPEVDFGDKPIEPIVSSLNGAAIIRTDGTTLLGADDKCGCTIAMMLIRDILSSDAPHGEIQFAFCPNEDIGMAAERIDTAKFSPDILFDIDGEDPYGITDSNFTAWGLNLLFKGNSVHPSEAKELGLGDATAAAATFIAEIPVQYRPEHSEGKEGYIHPWNMTRKGQDVLVETRVRYFSKEDAELYDDVLKAAARKTAALYPNVGIETVYDGIQYENVAYTLHPAAHDVVNKAAEDLGIKVDFISSRGGTTASMFAAKGLKGGMCIFSGQHNAHSLKEYANVPEMRNAFLLMRGIVKNVAKL